MADVRAMVIAVLRNASGPLSWNQIRSRIVEHWQPGVVPPTREAISSVLYYDSLCARVGRGLYVYLPDAFVNASFRLPLFGAEPQPQRLPIDFEVWAALSREWADSRAPSKIPLRLAGGPSLEINPPTFDHHDTWLTLPPEFWDWLPSKGERGADWLVLRCLDAEEVHFSLEPIESAELDPMAVAARNARVAGTAREVVIEARGRIPTFDLVKRLVARGVYRGDPPPDPLSWILFEEDGRFHLNYDEITFREGLTPALRRVLADRLHRDRHAVERLRGTAGGPITMESAVEPEGLPWESPVLRTRYLYRFKVTLRWMTDVWRVIEIEDDRTLADLHLAIQRAFGWDDEHLYAFSLSGQETDTLMRISCDYGMADRPTAEEVRLYDLERPPNRKLLYQYNFTEDLCHDVELTGVLPRQGRATSPRVVEVHGEAPPEHSDDVVWEDDEEER